MKMKGDGDMELSRYNVKRFVLILLAFFVIQASALLAISYYFSGDDVLPATASFSEMSVCANKSCSSLD